MSVPEIVVDLNADYLALLKEQLASLNVPLPDDATTIDHVSYIFWNVKRRLIAVRPRKVHLAGEFRMPPEKADQEGVALLLGMLAEGYNVNGHLSEAIRKPKPLPRKGEKHKPDPFHDQLFNHWEIHHFHLGDVPEGGGFAERTSLLLFAIVKQDDVYIIDVLPHGKWSQQDLLDRVHTNWPVVLEGFKQPRHERRGDYRLTDEQVAAVRKKGASATFIAKDGTEYLPPGGGQVAAGIGLHVVRLANRSAGVVSSWNAWLKENPDCVADTIRRAGKEVPEIVTLKLEIDDNDDLHALDETLRVRMRLGPLFPPPGG